jgi:hypothetical protein
MAEYQLWLKTRKDFSVLVRGLEIPPPAHEHREEIEFVALTDASGDPCGSLRFQIREHHLWVIDIQVATAQRRKGIASLLLGEVLRTGRFAGYTHVYAVAYGAPDRALFKANEGIGEENPTGFGIFSWGL